MIIFSIFLSISLIFWLSFGHFCFSNAHLRRKSRISERNDFCGGSDIPEEAKIMVKDCRKWLDTMEYEAIYISSNEGYSLFGRLIEHDSPKGTVIFAHGYHSSCRRDLAIQARSVYEDGYNILLISQRAHGLSQGKYICFGAKERYDVVGWAEYVCARYPKLPVALFGLSMGGATVMMASELDLPPSVKCIISDCGFTSPREIISNTLRYKRKIIVYPTIIFMELWAMLLAKLKYDEASTLKALKVNTRPLLLIHGEDDLYVPTEMSKRNAALDPSRIELLLIPNAKHAQAVYFDSGAYISRVLGFLNKNMTL